jgi:hypothetical protein
MGCKAGANATQVGSDADHEGVVRGVNVWTKDGAVRILFVQARYRKRTDQDQLGIVLQTECGFESSIYAKRYSGS